MLAQERLLHDSIYKIYIAPALIEFNYNIIIVSVAPQVYLDMGLSRPFLSEISERQTGLRYNSDVGGWQHKKKKRYRGMRLVPGAVP